MQADKNHFRVKKKKKRKIESIYSFQNLIYRVSKDVFDFSVAIDATYIRFAK